MANPRLDPSFPVDPRSVTFRITWDPAQGIGKDLPDAYFAAVTARPEEIASARLVSPRVLEVTLTHPAGTHAKVVLWFPDRRGFLSCSHRGMDDHYGLEGDLRWLGGDGAHPVESFIERYEAGAI